MRVAYSSPTALAVLILLPFLAQGQEDSKKPIPPSEARRHVGKQATVELTVQSSRLLADRNLCFLNSRENYRDQENFVVLFRREGLEALAQADVSDPAKHFLKKKIRVTGRITLYRQRPQIEVLKVEQIKLIKESEK